MTPDQLHSLIDALILLIVAVSGAITAYTHWKVQQLPTKEDNRKIAAQLVENGKALDHYLEQKP